MNEIKLNREADSILALIKGKSLSKIFRPRDNEICLEFSDGTRFFIDTVKDDKLEFSITG